MCRAFGKFHVTPGTMRNYPPPERIYIAPQAGFLAPMLHERAPLRRIHAGERRKRSAISLRPCCSRTGKTTAAGYGDDRQKSRPAATAAAGSQLRACRGKQEKGER